MSSLPCSNEMTYNFEIWYRGIREGFLEDLEVIFSKFDLDFFKVLKYFNQYIKFSFQFTQLILLKLIVRFPSLFNLWSGTSIMLTMILFVPYLYIHREKIIRNFVFLNKMMTLINYNHGQYSGTEKRVHHLNFPKMGPKIFTIY